MCHLKASPSPSPAQKADCESILLFSKAEFLPGSRSEELLLVFTGHKARPTGRGTTAERDLWPEHALSGMVRCRLSRHCCGPSMPWVERHAVGWAETAVAGLVKTLDRPVCLPHVGWPHASLATGAQETFKLPFLSSSRDPQTSNSSPRRAEEKIPSLVWEPFSAGNDTLLYLLTETLFHETLSSVSPNRYNGAENVLSPGIAIPCLDKKYSFTCVTTV